MHCIKALVSEVEGWMIDCPQGMIQVKNVEICCRCLEQKQVISGIHILHNRLFPENVSLDIFGQRSDVHPARRDGNLLKASKSCMWNSSLRVFKSFGLPC